MKINPHAIVVPFIVMVNLDECSSLEDFNATKHDQYNYFIIGGSHLAEAKRQLVKEHPTTFFFKSTKCKIYVALTIEEAKLLCKIYVGLTTKESKLGTEQLGGR